MPAPAVIPAPRAYINAVAVKGFVVELRPVKETTKSHPPKRGRRPSLLLVVNKLKQVRGSDKHCFPFPGAQPPHACDARTEGRPRLLL